MTVYQFQIHGHTKPPLSLNDRHHWAEAAKLKRAFKNDVFFCALQARLPKDVESVHVQLIWHPQQNRRRDTDNPTPSLKVAIDGLVNYGLVSDDNARKVSSECVIGSCRKPAELWLRIETSPVSLRRTTDVYPARP